jgi:hypothetical protein
VRAATYENDDNLPTSINGETHQRVDPKKEEIAKGDKS